MGFQRSQTMVLMILYVGINLMGENNNNNNNNNN